MVFRRERQTLIRTAMRRTAPRTTCWADGATPGSTTPFQSTAMERTPISVPLTVSLLPRKGVSAEQIAEIAEGGAVHNGCRGDGFRLEPVHNRPVSTVSACGCRRPARSRRGLWVGRRVVPVRGFRNVSISWLFSLPRFRWVMLVFCRGPRGPFREQSPGCLPRLGGRRTATGYRSSTAAAARSVPRC